MAAFLADGSASWVHGCCCCCGGSSGEAGQSNSTAMLAVHSRLFAQRAHSAGSARCAPQNTAPMRATSTQRKNESNCRKKRPDASADANHLLPPLVATGPRVLNSAPPMLFSIDHASFCGWVVFRGVPGINNVTIGAVRALCENAPLETSGAGLSCALL